MVVSSARRIRDILVFGAVVAIIGLLMTFASQGLRSIVDSRSEDVLSRIAKADSARILSIKPAYPKLGGESVYSLDTTTGTKYGRVIALSIPGMTGPFAAIFSSDGQLSSLVDLATQGSGRHAPGYPSVSQVMASFAGNGSLAGTNPLDPADAELSKCLAATSAAIVESLGKASKQ